GGEPAGSVDDAHSPPPVDDPSHVEIAGESGRVTEFCPAWHAPGRISSCIFDKRGEEEGRGGGEGAGQAWRAALSCTPKPSRGSASTAPVTELRRNRMPLTPDSSSAFTV